MTVKQEINKIYKLLLSNQLVQVHQGDFLIHMRLVDGGNKISLSTQVYQGENFIPPSVRKSVKNSLANKFGLKTYLIIDEDNFRIYLNCVSRSDNLNTQVLNETLEEFEAQAEEWRLNLDENDRNDHVHLHVRS